MNPKFSIIIPVYNVAYPASVRSATRRSGTGDTYLHECLDSVLAQTFTDWEAICVDDGSTDGSGMILDEYAAKDGRFRVVHQKNAGVSAARNAAIELAKGMWVWCVDGDDTIANGALEILHSLLQKRPDATCIGMSVFAGRREELYGLNSLTNGAWRCYDQVSSEWMNAYLGGICQHVLKRETIGDQRFGDFKLNEDGLFMAEYAWKSPVVTVVSVPLYYYRQREGSATKSRSSVHEMKKILESQRRMVDIICSNYDKWQHDGLKAFWKGLHGFCYYGYGGYYFRLSAWDRKKLLPEWIGLQKKFYPLYPVSVKRRIVIILSEIMRSGLLVRMFVYGMRRVFGD